MGLGKLFAHLLVLRSSGFSGKVFVGILSILCRMQAERDLAEGSCQICFIEEFMSDLFVHTSDDRVVLLPPMNGCGSDESLPSGDSRLCMSREGDVERTLKTVETGVGGRQPHC
ncbi:uncharacterized protein LOC123894933 isoform X3 [Trifolium pratense]|uniref:Uncharacterized protein n=1 Tax=Trifolium pratense TaxID=57577 RepID=A0ACB0KC37_TRIPR|nr:uncharacterized protein LOC123884822 isoform X3 [Trifolium pratense]XP_045801032.1 uncharacterized protein LOC123894933 isoform X3 [Trifolium pratense]XP_045801033.1 uncharacterized protein LOC123894933 isoform X3 [Trifolium pratense]CAJ2654847.1 unnamed protein product [Trifolium pratense]